MPALSEAPPIRVGLLVDDFTLPAWAARIVDRIVNDPGLQLALVVLNGSAPDPRPSLWRRLRKNHFLYYRFRRLESWYYRKQLGNFDPPRDMSNDLADIPKLPVVPRGKKYVHRFHQADVDRIREHQLDLMIRFGFKIIRGDILQAARYGIWSFHHGDNDEFRGGPAGFWEVYRRAPRTGVTLQVLTEELDGGHVLGKTEIRTAPNSPALNSARIHQAGVRLMDDALDYLKTQRPEPTRFLAHFPPSSIPFRRPYDTKPTNLQMLRLLTLNLAPNLVGRIIERLRGRREQWVVGAARLESLAPLRISAPKWFLPSSGSFLADVFPYRHEGNTSLFVEHYPYETGKGVIAVLDANDPKSALEPRTVLETESHLSFPFVFNLHGAPHMIPEQMETGRVALYRCVDFPFRWEFASELLSGVECADTVLFEHNATWWMFTTKNCGGFTQNNLYLYHAPAVEGPWMPHPRNPISNSLFGSRMAGHIIHRQGKLYRPGQDCSTSYGRGVVLYEIVELSTRRYAEKMVARLDAADLNAPGSTGIHTLNVLDDVVYFDSRRWIR